MNPKLTVMFGNGAYSVWYRGSDWVWHIQRFNNLELVLTFIEQFDSELRSAEFNVSEVVGVPA